MISAIRFRFYVLLSPPHKGVRRIAGWRLSQNHKPSCHRNKTTRKKEQNDNRGTLAIREKHFGYDHPSVAIPLGNLAAFYRAGGLTSVAEPLARKALIMSIKDAGSQHPMTAQCLNNLATILMDQQRFDEAESLFSKALVIQQQVLGADHSATKKTQANLEQPQASKREQ